MLPPLPLAAVPFTRGQEQSRDPTAIRREMLSLGEAGYKEVTLLGQNIDAYGRDLPGFAADGSGRRANTFTDLLRYVHDVPGTAERGGAKGLGAATQPEHLCCHAPPPPRVRRHRAHPLCHLAPSVLY